MLLPFQWLLEKRTCPMCKMDILKHYGMLVDEAEEVDDDEEGQDSSARRQRRRRRRQQQQRNRRSELGPDERRPDAEGDAAVTLV